MCCSAICWRKTTNAVGPAMIFEADEESRVLDVAPEGVP